MTDHLSDYLLPFVVRSRWFGGKGRELTMAAVRRVGVLRGDGPQVAIDLAEIRYHDGAGETEYYQLPLAFYPAPVDRLGHAFVGLWRDDDFGDRHVYDALHDRDAMALWLRSFDAAPPGGSRGEPLVFHRLPGHELDTEAHSTLFSGEQSNSSVAFGEDSLMKVFRKVTPGVNPDVEIHEVLTTAGSDHVAALYGWLEAPMPGAADQSGTADDEGERQVLQLAMLQQFLRTASDGWDLALASVRNLFATEDVHPEEAGGDFAAEASRLGTALAETHETLATHFPTHRRDAAEMAALAAAMRGRLDDAVAVAPALEPYAEGLRTAYEHLAGLEGIRVQRIHGDLHLGQTLRTVKGWKIVDFEGEPAKPLADRVLPDSPWRDVAGMLRSFDYAPHVVERTVGEGDPEGQAERQELVEEWADRNRGAFLAAYVGRDLTATEQVLLAAYVADKAVYETVYETRNRPTWVEIPLAAIAGLAGERRGGPESNRVGSIRPTDPRGGSPA